MIVKFFNRGTGAGNGPVDYLLGKNRGRELARLDQGNPDEIVDLINSCEFTQKYKSGCLSFWEKDLPQVQKNKIMADFERVLLPGLDKNQYSILWVEHQDKGRLELNFVVPCVELTTAKRLQPYYHAIDKKRVDTWKRVVNANLDLHDPDAPENKRSAMDLNVTGLPQEKKQQIEHISNALLNHIEMGLVKNKSDIVRTLEDAGFTITRQAKKTISIKDPSGGKNIKLKGEIYEESFQFSGNHAGRVQAAQADYAARKPAEFKRDKAELTRLCRAKSERNKALYRVHPAESGRDGHQLQGIIEQARSRSAEPHRLSDKLSHIQDIEIQRGHTLNNVGVRGRAVGSILLDRAGGGRELSGSSATREDLKTGWNQTANTGRENVSNCTIESDIRFLPEQEQSNGMGVKIDDRARKTAIDRVRALVERSKKYVSGIQKHLRETAGILRTATAGKSESDSVSIKVDRASDEFNQSVERIIEIRSQKLKRTISHGILERMR